MKNIILLVFLYTLSPVANADNWDETDTDIATAYTLATVIDCRQTWVFSRDKHDGIEERNPLLGKEPSSSRIVYSCLGAWLGVMALAEYFPSIRRPLLTGALVVELAAVSNNYRIGVSISY